MLKKLNRVTAGVRKNRPVKVLQFGGGNFLHAFADWMIDIMNDKTSFDGDVEVVQPLRKGKSSDKNDQDHLYHVAINGIQDGKAVSETRLITCIAGTINPYEEFDRFLESAENPDLEFIISNTTESGISFNANDTDHQVPSDSFPGKLTSFLFRRFNYFKGASDKGLIVLPCELIEKNGEMLQGIIHQYIEIWKLPVEFKNWIDRSIFFYNTLVDRIVPGFPKDLIKTIHEATGYEDNHVVMAEPFHLWIIEAPASIENRFPAKKAGLDVKFADDLASYRTRKVRILNGAHTTMVPVAYLHGLRTVRESVDDHITGKFIRDAIYMEILPSLGMPPEELNQFASDVIERFQNPCIRHELSSIALNSISKFKVRVLPSLLSYIKNKKSLPERLVYSLAALIRFYKGDWRGEKIPVNDVNEVTEFFNSAWKSGDVNVTANMVLSNRKLWDNDLTAIEGLSELVARYLGQLSNVEAGKEEIPVFH